VYVVCFVYVVCVLCVCCVYVVCMLCVCCVYVVCKGCKISFDNKFAFA